jgi:Ser/Thr protein kinase RdoA (MazF antagonist)
LKQAGISVAAALEDLQGEAVWTLPCPEGSRLAVLFEAAPGNIPLAADKEAFQLQGALLAKVHVGLDEFSGMWKRPFLDIEALLFHPLKVLRKAFPNQCSQIKLLETTLLKKTAARSILGPDCSDFGGVHGDFLRVNFHATAQGALTLFDFDFCSLGNRLWDFATYHWALEQGGSDEHAFAAFLEGYARFRALPPDLDQNLPFIMKLRELWVWCLRIEYGRDFRRLNPHSFEFHMGSLHT